MTRRTKFGTLSETANKTAHSDQTPWASHRKVKFLMTNTSVQKLEFPFGTTPEEVIRERLADWQSRTAGNYLHSLIHRDTDPDDLITVLRSLHQEATRPLVRSEHFSRPLKARSLRVEALVSLGIKEG